MMILLHQTAKCQARKLFLILSFCLFFGETAAVGQSIIPANDGTGTTLTPQGNRLDISGGQLSGDGANLFHSFQRFGLNKNQTANFLSNPNIQNIFGRVVGGEASTINGLIQVSGGNSNLFLINPAGIIFSATSQLNVPASFTATTANSIGFGNNFLSAIGPNNYLALTGNPTSFVFSDVTPASIVNRGNLAVQQGKNLTLIGGTVTNTGQLSAPGGQINIIPVPGQSVVRISQPGYLLSLEVSNNALNSQAETASASSEKSPATLPEILTGSDNKVNNASDVAVNSDGSVQLTRLSSQLPPSTNSQTNPTGGTTPPPTNTPTNSPNNPTGGTATPPTNSPNNSPNNNINFAFSPQPSTENLNSPANDRSEDPPPQTNTTNPNPTPNNIQLPPNLADRTFQQVNNLQNTFAPNVPQTFPVNEQLISRIQTVPAIDNMQLFSVRPIIDNLPTQGNLDRTSLFTNIQPNSIVKQQINFNTVPTVSPNIQIINDRSIGQNPPPPAAGNIAQMGGFSGSVLPLAIPNIPSGVGNPPTNIQPFPNVNSLVSVELNRSDKYRDYFDLTSTNSRTSPENIRETLSKIASQTGKRSAIIYVNLFAQQLELLLFLPEGKAIRKTVPEVNKEIVLKLASEFRQEISNVRKQSTTSYKASAQKLYSLMIAPLEKELQEQNIDTLLFSLDTGLRSLPLAALHDGKQFLVEKYSLSQIPAFSLTDTRYRSIENASVLAMGADEFKQLAPLPAVPVELSIIVDLWKGKSFLNEQFTLENLRSQSKNNYQIIHLATHGEFKAGEAKNSFIQLWDSKLLLNDLRKMGWNNLPVELLVLSACRTALGDEQTELGFAGLAFQAGVKSALASLWYVSDEGTLALMGEFYHQLKTAPIKAEALRQAQIAMIKGQVRIEGGVLRGPFVAAKRGGQNGLQVLPQTLNAGDSLGDSFPSRNLAHPYFWAAFTMIGSPW
ncbi:MAG: CHAT domain-containing protein [Microcoleus sp.]